MNTDSTYMKRCLQLAELGRGKAAPNPMVGSVIVHEGKIIGEGYHEKCGEAHAEVNAVNSVKDKNLLPQSTLYVNLEPCAHHGKTPPCSDLIVHHKIKRVVVGCIDSFSKVAGKGIEKMRNAGIEVAVGVLEKESRELNKRFFTFHEKKRPYIILKWAQTLDGFIDLAQEKKQQQRGLWITNHLSKKYVHKWRTEEMAIMVGTNTALIDNPQLNVREWQGRNPVRVVFDRSFRLPEESYLYDGTQPTMVFTEQELEPKDNLEFIQIDFQKDGILEAMKVLHERNILSVIVEGGEMLLNDFIAKNLWDETRLFIGNRYFGSGIKAPQFDYQPNKIDCIGDSKLLWFRNDG